MAKTEIKGQGIQGALTALKKLKGEEGYQQVLGSLKNAELKDLIQRGGIVPVGWYPLEWYADLHGAVREHFGLATSHEMGAEGVRNDVKSVFRFILGFASPQMVLRMSGWIFGSYLKGARMEWSPVPGKDNEIEVRVYDCYGANEAFWEDTAGSVEAFIEVSGGKSPRMKLQQWGKDLDHRAVWILTWG